MHIHVYQQRCASGRFRGRHSTQMSHANVVLQGGPLSGGATPRGSPVCFAHKVKLWQTVFQSGGQ